MDQTVPDGYGYEPKKNQKKNYRNASPPHAPNIYAGNPRGDILQPLDAGEPRTSSGEGGVKVCSAADIEETPKGQATSYPTPETPGLD